MAKKYALRDRVVELFSSAAKVQLTTEPVEQGKIYCYQQVAWEIDKALSGGNTRARLYIEGHGYNHNLEEQDAPTADTLWTYSDDVWLTPGERLVLELDQAQASTTAEMHITGYYTDFVEGIA